MKPTEAPRENHRVRIKIGERWDWASIKEVKWGHIFCEHPSSRLHLAYRVVDYGTKWRYAVDDPEACQEGPATREEE